MKTISRRGATTFTRDEVVAMLAEIDSQWTPKPGQKFKFKNQTIGYQTRLSHFFGVADRLNIQPGHFAYMGIDGGIYTIEVDRSDLEPVE